MALFVHNMKSIKVIRYTTYFCTYQSMKNGKMLISLDIEKLF